MIIHLKHWELRKQTVDSALRPLRITPSGFPKALGSGTLG